MTPIRQLLVINMPTVSSTDDEQRVAPGSELRVWWIPDQNKEHCDHFPFLEELIKYFRMILETKGPFDAILGFSQGAAAARLLLALVDRPELHPEFSRAGEGAWPPRQFSMAILSSGFLPRDARVASWFEDKLEVPSLHILGSRDIVVSSGDSNEST